MLYPTHSVSIAGPTKEMAVPLAEAPGAPDADAAPSPPENVLSASDAEAAACFPVTDAVAAAAAEDEDEDAVGSQRSSRLDSRSHTSTQPRSPTVASRGAVG